MSHVIKKSRILTGNVLEQIHRIPEQSIHCCITSPPYWGLRDYGCEGQLGMEKTPERYVDSMVKVFQGVKRVLRPEGTFWLNIGDSYAHDGACGGESPDGPRKGRKTDRDMQQKMDLKVPPGCKPKDLVGIPWMLAFALRADGWHLRQEIIWSKGNPLPESCTDRCVRSHESVFLLSKKPRYFFDQIAIDEPAESAGKAQRFSYESAKARSLGKEPGGNGARDAAASLCHDTRIKRDVWNVNVHPFKGSHFATFPKKLIQPMILAGTSGHGCCVICGAPWLRTLEKKRKSTRPGRNTKTRGKSREETGNRDPERHVTTRKTVGWEPSCSCGTNVVAPCVVFDPFFGAGTVGVVALKFNRLYVGIELNPEYVELAQRRIARSPGAGFGLLGK